jgi:hypothetical protein
VSSNGDVVCENKLLCFILIGTDILNTSFVRAMFPLAIITCI